VPHSIYRAKGHTRHKVMTLSPQEFMRRFLLHVLPAGFHRIRHYGLLANGARTACLATARELLHATHVPSLCAHNDAPNADMDAELPTFICRHCGHAMTIVKVFTRGEAIRAPP
ncbi:transposase, partial [Variovorax paradoxus]|nr:transposase [Variovorax paradoxus]